MLCEARGGSALTAVGRDRIRQGKATASKADPSCEDKLASGNGPYSPYQRVGFAKEKLEIS